MSAENTKAKTKDLYGMSSCHLFATRKQ